MTPPATDRGLSEADLKATENRIVAILDLFHDGQREKKARAIMVEVVEPLLAAARREGEGASRDHDHSTDTSGAEKPLTRSEIDTLGELSRFQGQNRCYWWRTASCAKLAQRGFAETYTPPSLADRRMKARPYRITEAGLAAIRGSAEGVAPVIASEDSREGQ